MLEKMPGASLVLLVPLPPTLEPWIALNVEFSILLCVGNSCRCAVSPRVISDYLRRKY